MSLNKEEIKMLHNNFKVLREHKLLDKIPFTVTSFPFKLEGEFTKIFDGFNAGDSNVYVQNHIAENVLKRCLVSFNNESKSGEEIESFSPEKSNHIIEKFRKLTNDIQEYLEGYEMQELTEQEVEEYILTDKIVREINLNYTEDIKPIKIKYHVLNLKENKEVGKKIKELLEEYDVKSKARAEFINEFSYATKMIDSINGIKIDEENINTIGVELIKFILNRAEKLEKQVTEVLSNPEKLGENLKN